LITGFPAAPAVPAGQLAPEAYEDASADDRLLRRIETVLQRRTVAVTVVLERLCDGHNYAAVLRTCEAAGIQNVVLIAPPPLEERYTSATMKKRELTLNVVERDREATAKRIETAKATPQGAATTPDPNSRRQSKRRQVSMMTIEYACAVLGV
jgi:tRNA G18 (ribose-2'-O)-methylase SpoU